MPCNVEHTQTPCPTWINTPSHIPFSSSLSWLWSSLCTALLMFNVNRLKCVIIGYIIYHGSFFTLTSPPSSVSASVLVFLYFSISGWIWRFFFSFGFSLFLPIWLSSPTIIDLLFRRSIHPQNDVFFTVENIKWNLLYKSQMKDLCPLQNCGKTWKKISHSTVVFLPLCIWVRELALGLVYTQTANVHYWIVLG